MDIEKYIDQYLQGSISVSEIAKLEYTTSQNVYYHLTKFKAKKPKLEEHLKYKDKYLSGKMTLSEIANELGLSYGTLARRFQVAGITKVKAIRGILPRIRALKKRIKLNENIIAYGENKDEAIRINIILKKTLRRWERRYETKRLEVTK